MATNDPSKGVVEASRRRSQRVILSLPVTVRSEGEPKDSSFEEQTQTLVVNLHGALVVLAAKVTQGQKLRLQNRVTGAEEVCRVASVRQASGSAVHVGLEFLTPSPDFWRISFPPAGWAVPDSSSDDL